MVDRGRRAGDALAGALKPSGQRRISAAGDFLGAGRAGGTRLGTDREDPAHAAVFMTPKQRRAHTQIIGGSGSGKSKLLEYLIRQDLEDPGCGLCLIDPHGSAYEGLLHYLSHSRPDLAKRVVLFDPADQSEMVLGFNPLGPQALEHPHAALSAVMTGILKAWGQGSLNETPRIGRWLENIFTVIISNRLTLLETLPLISAARDLSDRQTLLNRISMELVRQDWEEYDQASSQQRHAYIEGPHNRMRKFLRSGFLRSVFGVQERLLDVRRVVEEKQILLVNLNPTDEIDKEDMQMVGILLIHELFRAALRRDPRADPAPFYLYIDEFAQYVTDDIAYMLDECRKYGLFLTLIHQQLEQLKRESDYLYASVMTNCRNRAVFGSLSYRDAELLSQEMDTGFEDLLEVKYRTEQTKFRPIEELRPTFSQGGSHTEGYAAAFLQGLTMSTSVGRALARSRSTSVADSSGESSSESLAHALGVVHTLTHSSGESLSQMQAVSAADAVGLGRGQTKNRQRGQARGFAEQDGEGESFLLGAGDATSRASLAGTGVPLPVTQSHSENEQHGRSTHTGSVHSKSASSSEGEGESHQVTVQHVDGRTKADTRSKQRGESEGEGETETEVRGSAAGQSRSHTQSSGSAETTTDQLTRALAAQFSLSHSAQVSDGQSWSVAVSTQNRMEEFKEYQEHYYSLPEQRHRLIAQLKNQGVAEASFRFGVEVPVRVTIDEVKDPPWLPRLSPQRVAEFRQRVYSAHPNCYLQPEHARAEILTRQTERFGRPFNYDWFAVALTGESQAPALPAPAEDDDPFPPDL